MKRCMIKHFGWINAEGEIQIDIIKAFFDESLAGVALTVADLDLHPVDVSIVVFFSLVEC